MIKITIGNDPQEIITREVFVNSEKVNNFNPEKINMEINKAETIDSRFQYTSFSLT